MGHVRVNVCFINMLRGDSDGKVEGVETIKKRLYSKKATIVATGCWTGSVMHDLVKNWGMQLNVPVRPRKVCVYMHHKVTCS